jgi:predicted transcriptional regulator with HTH domain
MSKLSLKKRELISQQILSVLYDSFPKSLFTAEISRLIVRDEDFTKSLLNNLYDKKLIISIKKNSKGVSYLKRNRWRLSNKTHDFFSKGV